MSEEVGDHGYVRKDIDTVVEGLVRARLDIGLDVS